MNQPALRKLLGFLPSPEAAAWSIVFIWKMLFRVSGCLAFNGWGVCVGGAPGTSRSTWSIVLTWKIFVSVPRCLTVGIFRWVAGCLGISDDGVAAVAAGCLHLEHIYLNECTNLSDASIAFIGLAPLNP